MLGCVSKYQLRGEQHAIPQGEMLKYMILSVSVVLDHGLKTSTFWGEKSPIFSEDFYPDKPTEQRRTKGNRTPKTQRLDQSSMYTRSQT